MKSGTKQELPQQQLENIRDLRWTGRKLTVPEAFNWSNDVDIIVGLYLGISCVWWLENWVDERGATEGKVLWFVEKIRRDSTTTPPLDASSYAYCSGRWLIWESIAIRWSVERKDGTSDQKYFQVACQGICLYSPSKELLQIIRPSTRAWHFAMVLIEVFAIF
jgi:hypothetical protein